MHSSNLRGTDFHITANGVAVQHSEFFGRIGKHNRLGVVAPQRVDGVGATTLIMAHVTAFYDAYRAEDDQFFAYPAYFAFQPASQTAHYSMLDIWPQHKNVATGSEPVDILNAINDRCINILILPDGEPRDRGYEQAQLESARRNISACYLYSFDGDVADADLVISCAKEPLYDWSLHIFDEHEAIATDAAVQQLRSAWVEKWQNRPKFTQSFRRISLDEALVRL